MFIVVLNHIYFRAQTYIVWFLIIYFLLLNYIYSGAQIMYILVLDHVYFGAHKLMSFLSFLKTPLAEQSDTATSKHWYS